MSSRTAQIGLALAAPAAPTPQGAVTAEAESTVVVLGNDTNIIRSVEVVLREIELERVEVADCPDDVPEDDGCEEFSTGAMLVTLPLGGGIDRTITVEVAEGRYDALEFEIHKPDEQEDAAFVRDNIRASIEAFEDRDEDGLDDDKEEP